MLLRSGSQQAHWSSPGNAYYDVSLFGAVRVSLIWAQDLRFVALGHLVPLKQRARSGSRTRPACSNLRILPSIVARMRSRWSTKLPAAHLHFLAALVILAANVHQLANRELCSQDEIRGGVQWTPSSSSRWPASATI